MFKKLFVTLREIKKTACHHYGDHPWKILTFFYYGLCKINTFLLFEHALGEPLLEASFDPGFQVIQPSIEELECLRRSDKTLTREFFYDRIHGLRTCFVALYEHKPAYIHWVCAQGEHSRFLEMGAHAAEINYVATVPKYRGRHLSAKMIAYTTKYLEAQGYRRVFMICHEGNHAIIKSLRRAGYRQVRAFKSVGPFNKKYRLCCDSCTLPRHSVELAS